MKLFLSLYIIIINAVMGYYVRKEIPDHIAKTIGDPKIKHTAKHNITADMVAAGTLVNRDVTQRKSID